MMVWIETDKRLPEVGVVVRTKIDDAKHGPRNDAQLKRGGTNGNMWFTPDGGMYVYYAPTHWRPA